MRRGASRRASTRRSRASPRRVAGPDPARPRDARAERPRAPRRAAPAGRAAAGDRADRRRSTIATAVEAMKLGAADYVTKPFEVDALRIKVRQLLQHRALEERGRASCARSSRSARRLGALLGRSEAMREVFRTIERVAALARDRADQRRERHRQGAGGAGDPRARAAPRRALRRRQLRGDPRAA